MSHSFCWYMRGKYQLECLPFMVCTLLTNGKTSYIQTRYNIISGTFSQPANATGHFPIDLYISAVVSLGILFVVFPQASHVLVTWRPLVRSYPLPSPCPFVSIMFLSVPYLDVFVH